MPKPVTSVEAWALYLWRSLAAFLRGGSCEQGFPNIPVEATHLLGSLLVSADNSALVEVQLLDPSHFLLIPIVRIDRDLGAERLCQDQNIPGLNSAFFYLSLYIPWPL